MNTVLATNTNVVTKPFSDTVTALLRFSKQTEVELSLASVHDCLRQIYHPEMTLKDVIVVLLSAFNELNAIPQFETPSASFLMLKIAAAPIEGTSCLGGMFGPKKQDKYTVEEFYDSMIKQMLYVFRFSNVAWCTQYLFPEKVITHEHQSQYA